MVTVEIHKAPKIMSAAFGDRIKRSIVKQDYCYTPFLQWHMQGTGCWMWFPSVFVKIDKYLWINIRTKGATEQSTCIIQSTSALEIKDMLTTHDSQVLCSVNKQIRAHHAPKITRKHRSCPHWVVDRRQCIPKEFMYHFS